MTKHEEKELSDGMIGRLRQSLRAAHMENNELKAELKARNSTINIWYALIMLGMVFLLFTAVADDIRLRFVIAENTLLTEQLLEDVELYADTTEARQDELEGMVFSGADAMTGCADTLNLCSDRASALGIELEKTLGREAKWRDVARECLGLSD